MTISPYSIPGIIKTKAVTPQRIINTVCYYFGIEYKKIIGKRRNSEIIFARFIAIYLICNEIKVGSKEISFVKVGEIFNKDRTTVSHACETIDGFISIKDSKTITALNELKILIKQ